MVAATYTTDLITLSEAENDTGWAEPSASGWTSLFAVTSGETDYFIQNSACNSATVKTGVGGLLYDAGSPVVNIPTDGAVLIWMKWDAPNSLAVESSGGIRVMLGEALNTFYGFQHLGSDTYTYGGWRNLANGDPAFVTPDYTAGTPNSPSVVQYVGWAYNAPTSVPSKGNPYGVDVVRYGRCRLQINGGDISNGYATFLAAADKNDSNGEDSPISYNRWGLLQAVDGGYLWKGMLALGWDGDSPLVPVDFRDSNTSILIDNTKKVTSAFNRIEVRQAGSRVDWTAIAITALGTVSRGQFEAIDNATINIDSCTFTDMDTFIFQSNSTVTDTIFRRCNQVTVGSGTFNGCTFDNSTASSAVSCSNLEDLTDCTFNSDGSGHAVTLTSVGGGSMDWNNTDTGYGESPETNATIFVNVGAGSLTINVGSGYTTPSIRTAGATVNVVSGAVTIQVTAQTDDGTKIENARVLLKATSGSPTGPFPVEASVTIARSGSPESLAIVSHTGHGMATNDYVAIDGADQAEYNGVKQITVIDANSYSFVTTGSPTTPATGTITSTFVALYGLTNANGVLSTSRAYSSNQPVTGWARKSTTQPYYREGSLNGTIDTGSGFTGTAVMISDE